MAWVLPLFNHPDAVSPGIVIENDVHVVVGIVYGAT